VGERRSGGGMGRMGREVFGSGNGALRIRGVGFAVDGVFLDFVTEGGGFGGMCSCSWLYPLISSPIFSFVLLFPTPSLSFHPLSPAPLHPHPLSRIPKTLAIRHFR